MVGTGFSELVFFKVKGSVVKGEEAFLKKMNPLII
jgi:hypothetical protein